MTAHTIVIKALPTRTPSTLTITGQLENDMFDEMYGDPGGPRKRRRLTHLSPDEKQLRRKLKNRVAAQTARDRKKCLMDDLELKIAELERQNRQLASENASLKAESGSLQTENVALKKQLGAPGTPIKTEPGCGSAVSNDLLLQGQTLPVSYSPGLVSLLSTTNHQSVPSVSTDTVQLSSLPGTTMQSSAQSQVVGPTATELESFNELIQFDHIYYKPQPKGKKDPRSLVMNLKSDQTNSQTRNVRVIISSEVPKTSGAETARINTIKDVLQISDEVLNKNEQKYDICQPQEDVKPLMDDFEIAFPSDADSSALMDLNFDLLEDLESILKTDSEGLSCPDNVDLQSQMDNLMDSSNMEETLTLSRGQKRKAHSLEVEAIVDSLTKDMPSPLHSSCSDSDYMSEVASPYSSHGIGSPFQDNLLLNGDPESPLSNTIWEESFTELFPDLM